MTDDFIRAVRADLEWPLAFASQVVRRLPARALWQRLLEAAAEVGEPGLLFVDRINRTNNLWYRERLSATNPCGEVPLPAYGACNLGSLNLPLFVRQPFAPAAAFDFGALEEATALAVRFLDDVIDISRFPLHAQAAEARATRRLGLGVTGLADALIMLGKRYDAPEGRALAAEIARRMADSAYGASLALAVERGPFSALRIREHLEGEYIQRLPEDLRRQLGARGIRNSHLLAFAPAGTISLLAGNVSSGIEPVFRSTYRRKMRRAGGASLEIDLVDAAVARWRDRSPGSESLPPAFTDARSISPEAHVDMQVALQPFVDGAISKTVNLSPGLSAREVAGLVNRAYEGGLKGLTVFPSASPIGEVLIADGTGNDHACDAPSCAVL